MKRILIHFGSAGYLGSSIMPVLGKGDYDKFYLINRKNKKSSSGNIINIRFDDITNEKDIEDIFAQIDYNNDDEIFLLSTIGGFLGGVSIDETDYLDWQKMINLNLNASFLIAKYFIKAVRKAKSGSICFISAKSSMNPEIDKCAYNVSKNGLNFLVKSLALEGKKYNMSANAIAPFVLDSEENRKWVKDINNLVKPTDIGKLVNQIFASDRFINGNIFVL